MNETIKDKLRKVHTLAVSGIDGEKLAARKLLNALLKKYDICESDLYNEKEIKYEYRCELAAERDLMFALYCKIKNVSNIEYATYNKTKSMFFWFTKVQAIEFQESYDHYIYEFRRQMKRQRKIVMLAIIEKNDLHSDLPEDEETDDKPKKKTKRKNSDLTFNELLEVGAIMDGMKRTTPKKKLNK